MAEKNAKNVETIDIGTAKEHSEFPPFQKDTFASQLIWFALTFVALYLLMSRIALPRIGTILENRRNHIDADLSEAGRLKGQSEDAAAAYEKALADARNRAQALTNAAREQHAAEADAARKDFDARLNARIAEAEKDIRARQAAAMANVHAIGVDAATAIVEQLVGHAPASSEIEAAVAEALKP